MRSIFTAITAPLWRVIAVFGIFVIASGMLGSRIIAGQVLFRDGFAVYGGLGKALIFGSIACILLVRHRGWQVRFSPWHRPLVWWLVTSALLFWTAWWSIDYLIAHDHSLPIVILAHSGLLGGVSTALIGCIGPANLWQFWRKYEAEVRWSAVIAGLFYIFLQVVYSLWQPLASVVLVSVRALLDGVSIQATLLPPNTLIFDKFGVTVAEYCSGIESIALFSGLYIIVGLLDWPRLRLRRYLILFPIALLVLFGFNILRVFGLIVAGYYLDPELAFSLFHTYAGMVFFILYSGLFWLLAYNYLIQPAKKS